MPTFIIHAHICINTKFYNEPVGEYIIIPRKLSHLQLDRESRFLLAAATLRTAFSVKGIPTPGHFDATPSARKLNEASRYNQALAKSFEEALGRSACVLEKPLSQCRTSVFRSLDTPAQNPFKRETLFDIGVGLTKRYSVDVGQKCF